MIQYVESVQYITNQFRREKKLERFDGLFQLMTTENTIPSVIYSLSWNLQFKALPPELNTLNQLLSKYRLYTRKTFVAESNDWILSRVDALMNGSFKMSKVQLSSNLYGFFFLKNEIRGCHVNNFRKQLTKMGGGEERLITQTANWMF